MSNHDSDHTVIPQSAAGDPSGAELTDSNARKSERWALSSPVELSTSLDDPNAAWLGDLFNLGRGGVGILSDRPVQPGETVYVRDCSIEEPRVWLTGIVAHCTASRRGFKIGLHIEHAT